MEGTRLAALTRQRVREEEAATLSAEDVAGLERKLNAFRWILVLLFPRGFAFQLGEERLDYDAFRGRLRGDISSSRGGFILEIPKLTIKEAVRNNHVSELGISMFVRIRLLRRVDPRKVYALLALLQVDDYGHLASPAALLRWLGRGLRYTLVARLPIPPFANAKNPAPDAISHDARPTPGAPLSAKNRARRRFAGRCRFR